jgi:hypothetical protein
MIPWAQTVISQYSSSVKLLALLESVNEWISPDVNLEAFYNLIWNVDTAVGYGLDVWGRIVGVSRVLQVVRGDYFGFGEPRDRFPLDHPPFYDGQQILFDFELTDEQYRLLIFAKAALNITNCSIPAINRMLLNLFPRRGNCFVTDGRNFPYDAVFGFGEPGDRAPFDGGPFCDALVSSMPDAMTMTYVFKFPLEPFEVAIVTQSGVLPRSTGVQAFADYPM